jgi:hypothetical protein
LGQAPPDQVRVLQWAATESSAAHTATILIKGGRMGEKDDNRIVRFAFFIGAFLQENQGD